MRLRKKVGFIFMMAAALSGLLTGCGSNSENSGSGTSIKKGDDKTLNVGLTSDIMSLDYAYSYSTPTFQVVDTVNDFLLRFDDEGNLEPSLCTSWEAVDELTYVYQIRDDIKFSDGTAMTVDDVVFSMNRIKDPETASNMNFGYINVASIEATGDWEVTVKLSAPDSLWQYIPATPGGQVTSKTYYEAHKDDFGNADGKTIGTGAYKVDSWTTGSEIVLSKNENYWGGDVQFEKIVYTVIPDANSMQLAVDSGQIDFTILNNALLNEKYEASKTSKLTSLESLNDIFVAFNTAAGQCQDENLRKAISCCIDVETLTETQYGDYATPANALMFGSTLYNLDPETWESEEAKMDHYDYNIEKAKEYLAESAYDGSAITLYSDEANNIYSNMAQAIQASCAEAGIKIEIRKLPSADYRAQYYGNKLDEDGNREYDMIFYGWIPDYVDPAGYVCIFYESTNAGAGGSNGAGYVNARVDELMEIQRNSIDNVERSNAMIEACAIAAEDMPYKTICYPKMMYVTSNRISYEMPAFWLYSFDVADFKLAE